ncbi:TPA: hypothetical protein ACFP37_001234 [Neisseria subflava]
MLIEKVYRPAVLKAAYHNMILALITNIIKQKVVLKDKRQDKTAYSSGVYAIRTFKPISKPHQTDKNSNGFKSSVFFIHKTSGRLKTFFQTA